MKNTSSESMEKLQVSCNDQRKYPPQLPLWRPGTHHKTLIRYSGSLQQTNINPLPQHLQHSIYPTMKIRAPSTKQQRSTKKNYMKRQYELFGTIYLYYQIIIIVTIETSAHSLPLNSFITQCINWVTSTLLPYSINCELIILWILLYYLWIISIMILLY